MRGIDLQSYGPGSARGHLLGASEAVCDYCRAAAALLEMSLTILAIALHSGEEGRPSDGRQLKQLVERRDGLVDLVIGARLRRRLLIGIGHPERGVRCHRE